MSLVTVIVIIESVCIALLLAVLVIRQVKGQYVDERLLWRVPIVLAALALVYIPFTVSTVVPADAALTLIAIAIAVGVGLASGALTTVEIAATPDRRGRRVRIRSGWKGGALWLAFIAARFALQPFAATFQAHLVTSAGVVLALVAIARAVFAVVVAPRVRMASHEAATGHAVMGKA